MTHQVVGVGQHAFKHHARLFQVFVPVHSGESQSHHSLPIQHVLDDKTKNKKKETHPKGAHGKGAFLSSRHAVCKVKIGDLAEEHDRYLSLPCMYLTL